MSPRELLSKLTNYQHIIGILLFFLPFYWFSSDQVILGKEMFIFSYYQTTIKIYSYYWISNFGFGLSNLNITTQLYIILNYFLSVFFSNSIVQKIIFGLFLSSSYFSFNHLLSFLKIKDKTSQTLGSFFYVFNPFYIMMFNWIPSYGFLFAITPLFLKQIFIVFSENCTIKNFIYLYFIGVIISVTGTNLAIFGLFFFIVFIYYLVVLFCSGRNLLKNSLKLFFVYSIIIASNIFWILPLFSTYQSAFGNAIVYKENFQTQSIFSSPILNAFTLNEYYWFDKMNNYGDLYYQYSNWYQFPSKIIMLVILCYIITHFFIRVSSQKKNVDTKILMFFSVLILLGIFLSKGTANPYGGIYAYFLMNVKVFSIYRASDIKFPFFVVLGISFLIAYTTRLIAHNKLIKNLLIPSLFILIVFLGLPLITGDVFKSPDASGTSFDIVDVPNYWYDYSIKSDENKLDGRTLLFPKNFAAFDTYKWGYEGGWLSTSLKLKSSIGYTNGYGSSKEESFFSLAKLNYDLFEKGDIESMNKAMSLFNIREIIQRNDFSLDSNIHTMVSYSNKNINYYSPDNILVVFSNNKYYRKERSFGLIDLYKLREYLFLPHIYTPRNIIISNQNTDVLSSIVSADNYDIRSAIYLENQSQNVNKIEILNNITNKIFKTPILEFKKINPTKYRVIVHNATDPFPLVFSESYHDGWMAYYVENKDINKEKGVKSNLLSSYKILDGNEEEQATKEELTEFINNGWITSVGNNEENKIQHKKWENNAEKLDYEESYRIDFISKNFQDTIQNDNLDNGMFYETWLKTPIEDGNHLMANGYANSWIIDPVKLCKENKCTKNLDGSYEFELVIEFWPQRLLYVGLIIFGLTSLMCLLYLIYDWQRNKKQMFPKDL